MFSLHFLIKIVLGFIWIFGYRKIWITSLTTLDITKIILAALPLRVKRCGVLPCLSNGLQKEEINGS